jgi:hypothetical protein
MQSNVAIAMAGAGLLPAAQPRKKATIIGALAASGNNPNDYYCYWTLDSKTVLRNKIHYTECAACYVLLRLRRFFIT